ncbi:MAG: DUF547 domain-containing protein [Akkermansiaceae bacterium]
MRKFKSPTLPAIISIISISALSASAQAYSNYNTLLKKYAKADGVNYKSWAANTADKKELDKLLAQWSKVDSTKLAKKEQAAFRINLYNAAMLDTVLDHYPLKSVTKLGAKEFAIFDAKIIKTPNGTISLNTLEKKVLLKDFHDPRIHFAVNCASVSCPPLRSEAFNAGDLESQLNEQAIQFSNSSRAVVMSGSNAKYSQLFQWYEKDFGTKNPAIYLNKFRTKKLNTKTDISWIPYNWDLNEAK